MTIFATVKKIREPKSLSSDFWKREEGRLAKILSPWLRKGAEEASLALLKQLAKKDPDVYTKISVKDLSKQLTTWVDQYSKERAKLLVDTTDQGVRKASDRWKKLGLKFSAFKDMLAPLFGVERAKAIASTETTAATSFGKALVLTSLGKNSARWVTSEDEKVCPICAPLNGTLIKLGKGKLPPAHTRCRCDIEPDDE